MTKNVETRKRISLENIQIKIVLWLNHKKKYKNKKELKKHCIEAKNN